MQRIFCTTGTPSERGRAVSARSLLAAFPLIAAVLVLALLLSAPSSDGGVPDVNPTLFHADCDGVDVLFCVLTDGVNAGVGYPYMQAVADEVTHVEIPPYVKNPDTGITHKVTAINGAPSATSTSERNSFS